MRKSTPALETMVYVPRSNTEEALLALIVLSYEVGFSLHPLISMTHVATTAVAVAMIIETFFFSSFLFLLKKARFSSILHHHSLTTQ